MRVALDERGREMTTSAFARWLDARRQDGRDIAFLIGDKARAVKDDAVVAADKVNENYRLFLQTGAMRHHVASQLYLSLVIRRRVD